MSETGQIRSRRSLDDTIDAALREMVTGEAPLGLRARVAARLAGGRGARWRYPWLPIAGTAAAGLVLALLIPLIMSGPTTVDAPRALPAQAAATPAAPPAPGASPPPTAEAARGPARAAAGSTGAAFVPAASGPSVMALTLARGTRAALRAASLLGVSLLAPAPPSRAGDILAALEDAAAVSGEVDPIAIPLLAVAPLPPPTPVTIAAIEIKPIVVPAIDIPALEVKPLDTGAAPRSTESGKSRQQ